MKLVLLVTNANTQEAVEAVFDKLPVLIGRSKICDLVLNDGIASRQHAVFEATDMGRLQVVDLQSANGVLFSGQKVQKQELDVGDQVRLGDSIITVAKITVSKEETTVHELTPVHDREPVPELTGTKVIVSQSPRVEPQVAQKKIEASKKKAGPVEPGLEKTSAPVEPPVMKESIELTMKTPLALKGKDSPRVGKTKDWVQVSLFWKDELIDIKCFDRGASVNVGKSGANDFILEGVEFPDSVALLSIKPQGLEVNLNFAASGLIETRGKTQDLAELRKTARQTELGVVANLPFQDRTLIEIGPFSFFIQSVRLVVTEELETPLIKEPLYAGILGSVSIAFVIFLAVVFAFPAAEAEEDEEEIGVVKLEMPAEKPKTIAQRPPPKPRVKPTPKPQAKKARPKVKSSGTQGAGAKASGKSGKRGTKDSKSNSGGRKIAFNTRKAPPAKVPPKGAYGKQKREQAKRGLNKSRGTGTGKPSAKAKGKQGPTLQPKPQVKVEEEGLAGLFGARGGGGKANQGGRAEGSGLGGELEGSLERGQARGGLSGSRGSGGRGDSGTDYGGGGDSLDVGGLGTKGKGGGKSGFGLGSSGTKGEAEVSYTITEVAVLDGLTREEIERVVNANKRSISACYEKSLIQAGGSGLAGRLKVGWFVDRSGKAINIQKKSTFGSESGLFSCIARAISSWQFPKPRGGKGAQVDWPFVFRKGG